MKCIIRLKLGFINLCHHKFKNGFLDVIDQLCSCSKTIVYTFHYFLHCSHFPNALNTFLNETVIIDKIIIDKDKITIIQAFLYGNPIYFFRK